MKIKELHLVNFGKFTNKKIELESDLNIIYGENETGKSTIFHFIVGMFYGFYKPYVKNRRLLDIHETYNPWSGGGYSGRLLFFDDLSKRELRLERNFAQGKEYIKVFVEDTGEEITDDYDLHPIYRLPDIAAKHIGVSYATFINTLAIKQLGHETDENLDKELKETVVNALSTHSIDVSVNKVQDKITKELDRIGSGRRKTSTYYLKKEKIVALENEISESKTIHHEILQSKDESKALELDKEEALKNLSKIKMIESFKVLKNKENIVAQARVLNESMTELKLNQKKLNISDEFSIKEVEIAIEESSQLNYLLKQLQKSDTDISDVEKEISQLKAESIKPATTVNDNTLEKLTKDIYTCSLINEESHDLSKEIRFLKNHQEKLASNVETLNLANEPLRKSRNLGTIIGLVAIILLVISAVLMSQMVLFIIGVLIGITGIVIGIFIYMNNNKKLEQNINDYKQQFNELRSHEVSIKTQNTLLSKKANQVTKLLQSYSVEDVPSLTSLKDRWLKESMAEASISKIYESQLVSLEKLRLRRKAIVESKEQVKNNISDLESRLRPVTSYFQTKDMEDLKQVKDRLVEFISLSKTIDHEELRLQELLKFKSLKTAETDLEEEKSKFDKAMADINCHHTMDENWFRSDEAKIMFESKDRLTETINDIDQKIAGIHSKSEALSRGHRRVSEVEEELTTEKKALQDLDLSKKVYELIGETISTITDELQHNFAPLLNESVSSMVETITANKYNDIKINPQMLMRLKDPETHLMINASQLSRGTMDLFYLALRDALAKWVNGDKELPVLLDETFAHFDDTRLAIALDLFSKSERQVILFTCQKREVDLSIKEQLGHVITL